MPARTCYKKVASTLFSHVGLACIVATYTIMGGFLFQALEAPHENTEKLRIKGIKQDKREELLQLSDLLCHRQIEKENASATIDAILLDIQEQVTLAVKKHGWDGNDETDESAQQWSFAGSLLYSVTVITTIGYGHVAPKTTYGRLGTIAYALVGIPLTFLYLSHMGDAMAECFRLFYKKVCCFLCIYFGQPKKRSDNLEVLTTVSLELGSQHNPAFQDDLDPPTNHSHPIRSDHRPPNGKASSKKFGNNPKVRFADVMGSDDDKFMTSLHSVDNDVGVFCGKCRSFVTPQILRDKHNEFIIVDESKAYPRVFKLPKLRRRYSLESGQSIQRVSTLELLFDRSLTFTDMRRRRWKPLTDLHPMSSTEDDEDIYGSAYQSGKYGSCAEDPDNYYGNHTSFKKQPHVARNSLRLRQTAGRENQASEAREPTNVWREVCRYDHNSPEGRHGMSAFSLDWPGSQDAADPDVEDQRRSLKAKIEDALSRRISTFDPDVLDRKKKSTYEMKEVDEGGREVLFTDTIEPALDFAHEAEQKITVPVTICLIIIAVYIFAGALLFTIWEDWDYITGSYFCFVTLSTIGFGDIVPGTDMKEGEAHQKLILCSMWLAVGLSLLAMCFNLMQEEVKEKFIWLGKKLGILKEDEF